MQEVQIQTQESEEVVDITDRINKELSEIGVEDGVCFLSLLHTTAALSTADLDPGTDLDMLDAFREIVPEYGELDYRHPHDPEHTPDHILSTLIGTDLNLPVKGGELVLGSWQRVVLFEFNGPRERSIIVQAVDTN